MGRTGPLYSVILLFLPGVLLAWRAKRRGRRWLLWFLLAILGPTLTVLKLAFTVDEMVRSGSLHSVIRLLSPLRDVSMALGGLLVIWLTPLAVVAVYLITGWIGDRRHSGRGYQRKELQGWCPECNTPLSPGTQYCSQCGYGRDESLSPEKV
jgi:hypothetical protein